VRLIPQALKPGNTLYVVAHYLGPTDVQAMYAVVVTTDERPTDNIIMLTTSFDAIREFVSRTRCFAVLAHRPLPPAHMLLCAVCVRQCVFAGGLRCNKDTDGPPLDIEPMRPVSRSVRN